MNNIFSVTTFVFLYVILAKIVLGPSVWYAREANPIFQTCFITVWNFATCFLRWPMELEIIYLEIIAQVFSGRVAINHGKSVNSNGLRRLFLCGNYSGRENSPYKHCIRWTVYHLKQHDSLASKILRRSFWTWKSVSRKTLSENE